MRTNKILFLPAGLLAIVLFFYFKNYLFTKREFIVYHSKALNICFMIDNSYKIDELTNSTLKYSGQKNSGYIQILKRDLSPKLKKEKINGFSAGYLKKKNLRVYEYKLNTDYILRDEFVFASKLPLNLVPYREQCLDIEKYYKKIIPIFKDQ